MPKLLCLANYFVGHGGGVEQVAHSLAQGLADRPGWDVTLAAHGSAPTGTRYTPLALAAFNALERLTGLPLILPDPRAWRRLKTAVSQCDVLLLHDNVYLAHLAAQMMASQLGKPVIIVKHTGLTRLESRLANLVQRGVRRALVLPSLRRADAAVFVTDEKKVCFSARDLPERVETIVNGIDTDVFRPFAAGLGTGCDVLFVSRFVPKKGMGVVRELAKSASDLRFTCAGFGPDNPDDWHLPNITTLIQPSADVLVRGYALARLLVLPAETEGTPLVVYEALACGTSVLAGRSAKTGSPALDRWVRYLDVDLSHPAETARAWLDPMREMLDANCDKQAMHADVAALRGLDAMTDCYARLITSLIREAG